MIVFSDLRATRHCPDDADWLGALADYSQCNDYLELVVYITENVTQAPAHGKYHTEAQPSEIFGTNPANSSTDQQVVVVVVVMVMAVVVVMAVAVVVVMVMAVVVVMVVAVMVVIVMVVAVVAVAVIVVVVAVVVVGMVLGSCG